MIPSRRGYEPCFTVRINQLHLLGIADFSERKKGALKFFLKCPGDFICGLRRYRAQQGVVFTAGKGDFHRIQVKTPAKIL